MCSMPRHTICGCQMKYNNVRHVVIFENFRKNAIKLEDFP